MQREISLKGSAETITKFLEHSFYSILYQRSIYPAEDFETVFLYGIHLIRSCNSTLTKYIGELLSQVGKWIAIDGIKEVVLVIGEEDSREILERWQFKVDLVADLPNYQKTQKEIEKEIQALMKQIAASVTFLPLIEANSNIPTFLFIFSFRIL